MTIRPMQAGDVGRVLEIADTLPHAPRWAPEVYEAAIRPASSPRRIALVAEDPDSGAVIGFAIASVVLPEAELETICVSGQWQRRRVGQRLLTEMTRLLAASEVTGIVLEVRASNAAARGLYQSCGFVLNGHRPGYYHDPKEDAYIMSLQITHLRT
jgi:ribosomal-protein-alanine N-acetyltransferase